MRNLLCNDPGSCLARPRHFVLPHQASTLNWKMGERLGFGSKQMGKLGLMHPPASLYSSHSGWSPRKPGRRAQLSISATRSSASRVFLTYLTCLAARLCQACLALRASLGASHQTVVSDRRPRQDLVNPCTSRRQSALLVEVKVIVLAQADVGLAMAWPATNSINSCTQDVWMAQPRHPKTSILFQKRGPAPQKTMQKVALVMRHCCSSSAPEIAHVAVHVLQQLFHVPAHVSITRLGNSVDGTLKASYQKAKAAPPPPLSSG